MNHIEQQLLGLVGKRITGVVRDSLGFGGDFATETIYGLRMDDNTIAWIQRDPEGNGPGHLDIANPTPKAGRPVRDGKW